MSQGEPSGEGGQGRSSLEDWMTALAGELDVADVPLDIVALLDVARDVAHGVARPAAPLSLFLVGLAAGRRGGSPLDVETASVATTALATRWAAGETPA